MDDGLSLGEVLGAFSLHLGDFLGDGRAFGFIRRAGFHRGVHDSLFLSDGDDELVRRLLLLLDDDLLLLEVHLQLGDLRGRERDFVHAVFQTSLGRVERFPAIGEHVLVQRDELEVGLGRGVVVPAVLVEVGVGRVVDGHVRVCAVVLKVLEQFGFQFRNFGQESTCD